MCIRDSLQIPYTAQWLTMGSLLGEWLITLGDKRDDALATITGYAKGYLPPTE